MITISPNLPPALTAIVEKLNFPYFRLEKVGEFETFTADLAEWNLSLTDKNPCIWVKSSKANALTPPQLADNLKDVVRVRRWQNNTVLVFLDGKAHNLKPHLPDALPTYVIFDGEQQKRIQEASSPTVATLEIFLSQMSRSQLSPYEIHKPVTGSRFFGRRTEINKVLQHPNTNYLFLGIRQIGKTSLLKEIKRRMDLTDPPTPHQIRRLYVDCTVVASEMDFLRVLTAQLAPSELKMLMGRAAQSKRYQRLMFDRFADLQGGPVTFLVDELDRLLNNVSPDSELFDVLRAASNDGKARFIMAGYRQAMQAASNLQSPFFDLVTELRLGRMRRLEVYKTVVGPMERLRITIQNREGVVNRINRETAGLPNYVQFYCKTLLEQLDEDERNIITEDDLQAVYENHAFRGYVLDTFMSNTESRERALVFTLAAEHNGPGHNVSFPLAQIDELLKQRCFSFTFDQLDSACRNLEVAGVFNRVGKNYEFAIPLFQSMLQEFYDMEFLIKKVREELEIIG